MIEGINQYAGSALSTIKDSACYSYNKSSEFCGKMVAVIPKTLSKLSAWDGACLVSGAILPYSATLPVIIPTLATKYINASSEYEIDREIQKNRNIEKQYKDCKNDPGEERDVKLSTLLDQTEKCIKVMDESQQNYKKLADRSAISVSNFAKYMAIALSGVYFGGVAGLGALGAAIGISNRYYKNAEEKQIHVNLTKKSGEEIKKMEALKSQINIDKAVINRCRENNDKVEAFVAEVADRQNKMADKYFESEAEVGELHRRTGALDNQVTDLKKELEASNDQIEKLNKQLEQSRKENVESQREIEDLKHQIAALKNTKEPMELEAEAEGTDDQFFIELDDLFKKAGDKARL